MKGGPIAVDEAEAVGNAFMHSETERINLFFAISTLNEMYKDSKFLEYCRKEVANEENNSYWVSGFR